MTETEKTIKETGAATAKKKKAMPIQDSTLVKVKSNLFGRLYYVNAVTQEKIVWEQQGDIQVMTIAELRTMKQRQASYFKNQWLVILGVADDEACDASAEDICKYLIINQYYTNYFDQEGFKTAYEWNIAQIDERVPMLSQTAKENLIVALSGFVKDGRLDSRRQIKEFEKLLDCELEDHE